MRVAHPARQIVTINIIEHYLVKFWTVFNLNLSILLTKRDQPVIGVA